MCVNGDDIDDVRRGEDEYGSSDDDDSDGDDEGDDDSEDDGEDDGRRRVDDADDESGR